MRQVDIKKGCYYSNGKTTRRVIDVVFGVEMVGVASGRVVTWMAVEGPALFNHCKLETFAKWAKKRVVPVWVAARPCPDCEGWCTETSTVELTVDLECPGCGYFHEEGT